MANRLENVLHSFLSEGFPKLKKVKKGQTQLFRNAPQGSINHRYRNGEDHSWVSINRQDCPINISLSSPEVLIPGGTHILTGAAEALLPHPDQHVQAEIAVGRFVKVLESPHMLSIIFHVLHGT